MSKKIKPSKSKSARDPRNEKPVIDIPDRLQLLLVDIDSIKIDPENARRHPEEQIDAIANSIRRFGFRSVVNVRRRGMVCQGGEGRILAARKLGMKKVPVIINDDDERGSRAFNIADNRAFELGYFDDKTLAAQLRDLNNSGFSVLELGFSEEQFKKLSAHLNVVPPSEFPVVDENIHTDYRCPKCGYCWSGGVSAQKN